MTKELGVKSDWKGKCVEERQYPEGIDCVWIGCDREGRVGVFVTGGEGPIPALALEAKRIPVK
jgi:hypothetical protein